MRPPILSIRLGLMGLALAALSACASASSPEQMVVPAGAVVAPAHGSRSDQTFRLGHIGGGGQTSAIGLSDVSNETLQSALETSLRNLGYLSPDSAKASFIVDADLVDLERSVAALDPVLLVVPIDMTSTARIHYVVRRAAGGPPVFDDTVATTGVATVSDAFTPAGRVKKANETAVRQNIVEFIQRLEAVWK